MAAPSRDRGNRSRGAAAPPQVSGPHHGDGRSRPSVHMARMSPPGVSVWVPHAAARGRRAASSTASQDFHGNSGPAALSPSRHSLLFTWLQMFSLITDVRDKRVHFRMAGVPAALRAEGWGTRGSPVRRGHVLDRELPLVLPGHRLACCYGLKCVPLHSCFGALPPMQLYLETGP